MTSFVIEQFHTPDTHRSARRVDSARRRAVEQLAGRSVWCIAAAPTETPAADALEHCLCGIRDQGVAPYRTLLQLREPLIGLMERIDAWGPRDLEDVDWAMGGQRLGGVAVPAPLEPRSGRICHRVAIRSYRPRARAGVAAYIAAAGVVSAKEVDATGPGSDYEEIGWTTLLADVVRDDRAERVGGTVHARPSVAAR